MKPYTGKPPTTSRDVGTDAKKRLRITFSEGESALGLGEVTVLGPSGVFAPAGRWVSIPLADVPALIEQLYSAFDAARRLEGGE